MKAVSFSEIEMAEAMLKKKSVDANKLCLSSILKFQPRGSTDERKNFIRLIERLLQAGIDSNKKGGDKDMCPLDVVLELSKDYEEEKIELLTLLIEHHADIGRCTYQKKNQTTLLHIAAKWAIQSGSNDTLTIIIRPQCSYYSKTSKCCYSSQS
jgi:histidinol phosphatase-like enzyme